MAQIYGVAVGEEERVARIGSAADEHTRYLVAAIRPRREDFDRVKLSLRVLPFRPFRQMEGISERRVRKGKNRAPFVIFACFLKAQPRIIKY